MIKRLLFPPCVVVVTLMVGILGCSGKRTVEQPSNNSKVPLSASQLLEKVIDTYRDATSYSDDGVLRMRYRLDGKSEEKQEDLAVDYVRPNKLFVSAYNVQLACDNESLRYKVEDETTEDMDNQFVVRECPSSLWVTELYDFDKILPNFLNRLVGPPMAMELLLADKPLELFYQTGVEKKLLDDATFDGHSCHRVDVTLEAGTFVVWIDRDKFLVRCVEYPAKAFLPQLSAVEGISDLKLIAEFHGAQFSAEREDFGLSAPKDAKRVRRFVTLPAPLPTNLLGKRLEKYFFTKIDGGKVTHEEIEGTLTVLVWFNNHAASQFNLQKLQQIQGNYKENNDVRFLVVCTDPTTQASNQQVEELLKAWEVDIPLVRDLEPFGKQLFGIHALPTMVVLDKTGKLQYFEVLEQPRLEQVLPAVIQRLLSGDDLVAEQLNEFEQAQASYHRALSLANKSEFSPRKDPKNLQLTELWTCDKLAAPGNILAVEDSKGGPFVLVNDGWRTVAQLDPKGKVSRRHKLDMPDGAAVTYVRTALDGKGRRWFAAGEVLGQQVHLFDQNWKPSISYPPADQRHGGIRDVQLQDLDGDGTLEMYVGYWDLLGVQQVSLEGKRLAGNRVMPKVLSMATSPKNEFGWRKLLITDDRGKIAQMNQFLRHDPPVTIRGHAISHLFEAEGAANDDVPYCGLAFRDEHTLLAVGISERMEVKWTYALPAGVFDYQIQFVTSGRLLDERSIQWLIARPDGTVHIIGNDGEFQDSFAVGQSVTGIAATRFGSDDVLLIATKSAVTAWRVSQR